MNVGLDVRQFWPHGNPASEPAWHHYLVCARQPVGWGDFTPAQIQVLARWKAAYSARPLVDAELAEDTRFLRRLMFVMDRRDRGEAFIGSGIGRNAG